MLFKTGDIVIFKWKKDDPTVKWQKGVITGNNFPLMNLPDSVGEEGVYYIYPIIKKEDNHFINGYKSEYAVPVQFEEDKLILPATFETEKLLLEKPEDEISKHSITTNTTKNLNYTWTSTETEPFKTEADKDSQAWWKNMKVDKKIDKEKLFKYTYTDNTTILMNIANKMDTIIDLLKDLNKTLQEQKEENPFISPWPPYTIPYPPQPITTPLQPYYKYEITCTSDSIPKKG